MVRGKKQPSKRTRPIKQVAMDDGQQKLVDLPEEPGPIVVVNGRILADYVKPVFTRDTNDDRYISLEFSVKLTEAHRTILPRKVLDAWAFVADEGGDGVKNIPIKPQTVRIYSTSDEKDEDLLLVGATIEHAKVDIVEERGSGEAVKCTRYTFRVLQERTKNLVNFACWKDGQAVWLGMQTTQASMMS